MTGPRLRDSTGALHLIRLGPQGAELQAPVLRLQPHGLGRNGKARGSLTVCSAQDPTQDSCNLIKWH